MKNASTILGITHLLAGLLVVALCIPLVLRRVAMNSLYGIRLAKAFESDANWYEINAFGGRVMAIAGAAIALLGIAEMAWQPTSTMALVLISFAPVPIVLLGLVPIVRFARRLR